MLLKHAKPIQSINNQPGESLREQDRVGYDVVCNMTIMCGSTLKHGISPYYYNQIHFTCMYRHLYLTTSTLHHCHFDQHHGQGGRLSIWGLGGQSFKFRSLKLGWPVNPPTWRFATDLTDPTSVYCDWGGCGMNFDMAFCCDMCKYIRDMIFTILMLCGYQGLGKHPYCLHMQVVKVNNLGKSNNNSIHTILPSWMIGH